jgi:hypothetical protein
MSPLKDVEGEKKEEEEAQMLIYNWKCVRFCVFKDYAGRVGGGERNEEKGAPRLSVS